MKKRTVGERARSSGGTSRPASLKRGRVSVQDPSLRKGSGPASGGEGTDRRQKKSPAARASSSVPRRLRIYAFDPLLDTGVETWQINRVEVTVPFEPLGPGPVGEYLEVIDVDPESGVSYAAVNLDDPEIRAQHGLAPTEDDPRFHQQMVYAVAMSTIRHFERALGRVVLWRPLRAGESGYPTGASGQKRDVPVRRLRVYPHAMRAKNAYYDADRRALLFGYFQAPTTLGTMGRNLPGGTVFTCLSHDIIAHETTHALLDGLHPRYMEPTNPDALAFHEGFADIVALLHHFTFPAVVRDQVAKTRGDLSTESLLGELAMQFGEATGNYGSLRSAIGRVDPADGKWKAIAPDPTRYARTREPHERGAILVSAVFSAFLSIYQTRTRDLVRLASGGSGVLPVGDLHPDLVNRLSREVSKSAGHVLTMCIRALDYCPPVDVTFGDYLRALVTADFEVVSDDDLNYRVALVEAFRRRGLYPSGVSSLSPSSLRWASPGKGLASGSDEHTLLREKFVRPMLEKYKTALAEMTRVGNKGWWGVDTEREPAAEFALNLRAAAHGILASAVRAMSKSDVKTLGKALGVVFDVPGMPFEVHSARPVRRLGPDGEVLTELLIETTQEMECSEFGMPEIFFAQLSKQEQRMRKDEPRASGAKFPVKFRGGSTLLIDPEQGEVRYCIGKGILKDERYRKQQKFLAEQMASPAAAHFGIGGAFARLHGEHEGD